MYFTSISAAVIKGENAHGREKRLWLATCVENRRIKMTKMRNPEWLLLDLSDNFRNGPFTARSTAMVWVEDVVEVVTTSSSYVIIISSAH